MLLCHVRVQVQRQPVAYTLHRLRIANRLLIRRNSIFRWGNRRAYKSQGGFGASYQRPIASAFDTRYGLQASSWVESVMPSKAEWLSNGCGPQTSGIIFRQSVSAFQLLSRAHSRYESPLRRQLWHFQ